MAKYIANNGGEAINVALQFYSYPTTSSIKCYIAVPKYTKGRKTVEVASCNTITKVIEWGTSNRIVLDLDDLATIVLQFHEWLERTPPVAVAIKAA